MRSKKFDEVKPYTYWIQNISTGIKYVGLRYRNIKKNRSPLEDFGIHYFTSGELKKEFKKYPENFKTKILYTYDNIEEAIAHELKLTSKAKDNNRYANIASYPHIVHTEEVRKKISLAQIGNKVNVGRKQTAEHVKNNLKARRHYKPSVETKRKIALALRGHKPSEEARKKMSLTRMGRKGTPWTEEQRKKQILSRLGKPLSEDHKRKLSLAKIGNKNRLGIKHPEEIKRKISLSLKGKPLSKEHKRKLKGRKQSKEHVEKRAKANKGKLKGRKQSAEHIRKRIEAKKSNSKNIPDFLK